MTWYHKAALQKLIFQRWCPGDDKYFSKQWGHQFLSLTLRKIRKCSDFMDQIIIKNFVHDESLYMMKTLYMMNLYTNKGYSVVVIMMIRVEQESMMTLLEFSLLQLGDPRCTRSSLSVLNYAWDVLGSTKETFAKSLLSSFLNMCISREIWFICF